MPTKQEEVRCPNCGKSHIYKGNGYCEECSAKFGERGMYSHIDKDGVLSNRAALPLIEEK